MYLKRLELYGFKSFADRTELEFVPGITAVVGPNGSGKSNVADAVRWVLGEQSAKTLRGSKMEDIIFAGSDTRKPINYAEVSLTLDNTDQSLDVDYTEVTVTRRVYRSGESEYFINKQPCRLKDIVELFMDTGVGKEAYSIIGQGRIEEILSTKAEDRRGIFEEAAGVVKYKNRKKEAERKLEETEANLTRIQDIIAEVEDQLGPLEDQAAKAKRYKTLKAELTQKEIACYVHLIETLYQEWEEANKQLEILKTEAEAHMSNVNRQEAVFEQLKWELNQTELKLDKLQQQLLSVTEDVEKLEAQREVLRERKKNFSSNKQDILAKIKQLQERRQQTADEWAQEREKLERLDQEIKKLKAEIRQKEEQAHHLAEHVDERLEQLKGDYIQYLNEHASLKNEYRHIERSIEQYEQRLKRLKEENKRYLHEREALNKELQDIGQQRQATQSKLEQLRKKYQVLKEKKTTLEDELKHKEAAYHQQLSRLEQLQARKQFLTELKEDFSGYMQGVKEILKARDSLLSGIDGAVAELITVPKAYELAIETALGAALQHIVVRDEAAAREAIAYLKKHQLGRATFLPRSVIQARLMPVHHRQIIDQGQGIIGMANELIEVAEKYRSIIDYLLGQVVVTQTLKEANTLAKQLQYRYRIVTLEGDIVNPGGSMTGGSVKKNKSNLLGREREIESLAEAIAQLNHALQDEKRNIEQMERDLKQLDEGLTAVQEEAERLKEKDQRFKDDLAQLEFQQKRLNEKLELYDQESADYLCQLGEAKAQKQQIAAKLSDHEQQSAAIEAEIKKLEQLKKENEQSKAETAEYLTRLKVDLAAKQQEYDGIMRHMERLAATKQEVEEELALAHDNLLQLEGNLGAQHTREDELEELVKQKKEEKEHLNQQIEIVRKERKEKQQTLEELEIQIRELRKVLKQTETNIHRHEVKVNRLDVELENYFTILREEYELSYELAKAQYPLPGDFEQVKQEVDQLKREIQNLGTVNLGAIEEYERLSERHSFLKEQEKDLLEAKETLYDVIKEMDEEMSRRFEDTFSQVRGHFQQVFQQLFGGGRADLILTEPDNLLTTGVDIMVQPPGKKLQHLSLLSGGERALTAIALLFAILRVKPVPFCVLDEVEAALDEANVYRFAQYLREFSRETQFIVITHRKGTMEGSDVLYGITMQESGVSKLVSVKLEDKQQLVTV
ncbi:chromosome partition protein Smc [Caldalkalibacillus thermarum]|uniref:chromosome segregation protein SMC n=1 Tax=Caldalkalibacillus thermarum TaxID=296745 RepID=UPI001665E67B|nr:chromosome segregation protein SMC [Caldalkalibacillus thermarum]GGK14304.1 chromosome partition protein Smc [Caldalkalibacillus thermarum]